MSLHRHITVCVIGRAIARLIVLFMRPGGILTAGHERNDRLPTREVLNFVVPKFWRRNHVRGTKFT